MIGIVCALERELGPLFRHTPDHCKIVAGGIGAIQAEKAARDLPDVDVLISAGYAGGIAPPAARGLIVVDTADPRLDHALPQAIRGRIADSQTMVSKRQARVRLAWATGAIAVDMESAAVAKVAGQRGIPFAAVRAITDGPDDDLIIQW